MKLPRVLFVTGKGGTGKSTVAAALAIALSRRRPTTLADLDRRLSAAAALGAIPQDSTAVKVTDSLFISLTLVLPALAACAAPDAVFVLLVKPQFEVGKGRVGAGGVVREAADRSASVRRVTDAAGQLGLGVLGVTASPLPGPAGNVEYFVWLRRGAPPLDEGQLERAIEEGPS